MPLTHSRHHLLYGLMIAKTKTTEACNAQLLLKAISIFHLCLHASRSRATAHPSKRIHKRQHASRERKVPKAKSIERAISHPFVQTRVFCWHVGEFGPVSRDSRANENSWSRCVFASENAAFIRVEKIGLKNGFGGRRTSCKRHVEWWRLAARTSWRSNAQINQLNKLRFSPSQ